MPIDWWHLLTRVLDHAPEPVLDDAARSGASLQLFVVGHLNACNALIFNVGKPDDMRNSFAFRVLTLVFFALVNSFDSQRRNLLGNRIVDLALEPDKRLVFVGQLFLDFRQRHVEQLGQCLQLLLGRIHVFRNSPNAWCGNARGKNQSIAIENPPTVRGQLQRAREPHLALLLEKRISKDLNVRRTPCQPGERQRNCRNNKFTAPHGRFTGE